MRRVFADGIAYRPSGPSRAKGLLRERVGPTLSSSRPCTPTPRHIERSTSWLKGVQGADIRRTFLSWLHFAVVLGGLAVGLLNFGDKVSPTTSRTWTAMPHRTGKTVASVPDADWCRSGRSPLRCTPSSVSPTSRCFALSPWGKSGMKTRAEAQRWPSCSTHWWFIKCELAPFG